MEIINKYQPNPGESTILLYSKNNKLLNESNMHINELNKSELIDEENRKYVFTDIVNNIDLSEINEMIKNSVKLMKDICFVILNEEVEYNDIISNLIKTTENNIEKLTLDFYQGTITTNAVKEHIEQKEISLESSEGRIDFKSMISPNQTFDLLIIRTLVNSKNIPMTIKLLNVREEYSKFIQMLSVNKIDNNYLSLINKIDIFMSFQKEIKSKVCLIPILSLNTVNSIEKYKSQCKRYFEKMVDAFDNIDKLNKENNINEQNLNEFIKEINEFKSFIKDDKNTNLEIEGYKNLIEY